MNLKNVVTALDLVLTAYRGLQHLMDEMENVRNLIDGAQSEGRDLTDDEVYEVRQRTDAALQDAKDRL